MWAVFKKELKSYFLSPIGYVVVGILLLVASVFFYLTTVMYSSIDLGGLYFYTALYGLLIAVPLLTMRMFSEERKTGTEQLLLTSPRSVTSIVLGKFFAACLVVLISTIATLMYYLILLRFGKPHFGSSIVAILGFSLLAIAYVSFGMFASSLTENQVIAAIISIGFFIVSWFLPSMVKSFKNLSLMNAFYGSFMVGTISAANLVLLLSFTVMFVLFTIMIIQRRKNIK